MIKSNCNRLFLGLPALLVLACAVTTAVSVRVQKPAAIDLPGVKTIAIADFTGPEGSGSQVATLVQSKLMESRYFDIIERDKLNRILDEQNLGMSGIVDENTAVQVGRLLGVDALIFGEVSVYDVEPDERGVEKVERKVGTGKYEWVEEKNIFTGKKKKVKREIMKTTLVDQHYRIRRGTVAVNFRVVGVESGRLLAAHSDSKSYNSGKVVEGSWKTLKPEGDILHELSNQICLKFTRLIAPYYAEEKRVIEPGKGMVMAGVKYAQNGLWEEALEIWSEAARQNPQDPVALYDMGLAYEVLGRLDEAEDAYKRSVALKQKQLYMESIARVRKAREEQQRLKDQMLERE